MEWLQKILASAVIGTDGKLDVEAAMKAVKAELPKHFVPKEDYNTKVTELKTASDTIKDLKEANADNETLQKTIKEHEETIGNLQAENEKVKKTYALTAALKEEGCTDPDYLIYKHGGVEKFAFDKDGKPIGVKDTIQPYKESKTLFPTGQKEQNYSPAGGGGGNVVNPFAKDTWNMTEQGKLFKENPAQARELASAAGINI